MLGKISVIWGLPAGSCVHSITLPLTLFALPFPQTQSLPCSNPCCCQLWLASPKEPPGCSRAGPTGSTATPNHAPGDEHCALHWAGSKLPVFIPLSFPAPKLSMADFCNFALSIPGRIWTPSPALPHPSAKVILLPPLLKPSYRPEIFLDPCREEGDINP